MNLKEAMEALNLCWGVQSQERGYSVTRFKSDLKSFMGYIPDYESKLWGRAAVEDLYAKYANHYVRFYGKPKVFVPDYYIGSSISGASLREAKKFRQWLRKEGQTYKRQGKESVKSWSNCEGKGRWTGFTWQILSRTRKHVAFQRRGHFTEIDRVMVECDISCFFEQRNLAGGWGVNWKKLMEIGPERVIKVPYMGINEYRIRSKNRTLENYIEDMENAGA